MSSYEISKSALLSLKAEILRKEETLTKAKADNVEKFKRIKKKALELKNKGLEQRQLNDLDDEELDLLKLSKSKLEAKTKLYEKLCNKNFNRSDEILKRYLVRFDHKDKDQYQPEEDETPDLPPESEEEEEEKYNSDYYDEDVSPDEQWVEYTDSLGRTRKCLRKDLKDIKARDEELREHAEKRHQTAPTTEKTPEKEEEPELAPEKEIETEEDIQSRIAEEESELISGEMRREMLRRQWEQEEEELRDKTEIHYQNVLFNEARQHGVGYYAFSKDEEERAKQQEALKKLRIETQQQQKKAQDLKALREKQLAARMKAAKNRKRARLGLPPEEDEPETKPEETQVDIEEENRKKKEAEENARLEAKREEARKRYVRPWDIGKDGVREFYQMSQDEWNEKKRKERRNEFAPPSAYHKREFKSMRSLDTERSEGDKSLRFSSKSHKPRTKNINPYKRKDHSDSDNENLDVPSKQSRTYEPDDPTSDEEIIGPTVAMKPVPIVNELAESSDFDDQLLADYHKLQDDKLCSKESVSSRKRTEIPPPPTYDYYGPGSSRRPVNNKPQSTNIGDSIEAGLKFLRDQEEKRRKSERLIFEH